LHCAVLPASGEPHCKLLQAAAVALQLSLFIVGDQSRCLSLASKFENLNVGNVVPPESLNASGPRFLHFCALLAQNTEPIQDIRGGPCCGEEQTFQD